MSLFNTSIRPTLTSGNTYPKCVCVCQKKVSKLIVHIDGVGGEKERQVDGGGGEREATPEGGQRREQLVQVCTWSDRRDGDETSEKRSATKPPADHRDRANQAMPSVRELAKHFSSNQVSGPLLTISPLTNLLATTRTAEVVDGFSSSHVCLQRSNFDNYSYQKPHFH